MAATITRKRRRNRGPDFWLADEEEVLSDGHQPGYSNVYLIAPDFPSFLRSLHAADQRHRQ